ncbi:MAG: universal stress protein [Bacteroidota bacterium]|nr:universal stress protein [Bacteroidota bacterium]
MKTLLVLIHEPKSSRGLIKYSVNLARELSLNLQLIYVENPKLPAMGTPNLSAKAMEQLQRNLEQSVKETEIILTRYVKEFMNLISGEMIIDITAEVNSEIKVLEKLIGEGHGKLLVLESTDKHSSWSDNLITNEIISSVECPVWIVPGGAEYYTPEEIVYATDYKSQDINTLVRLVDMLGKFSPTITALHITDDAGFESKIKETGFQKMLQNNTGYQKINLNALLEAGQDISKLINDFAIATEADLIVILKENRSFLERIFKASPGKKIIKHASIPVLVFHEKE